MFRKIKIMICISRTQEVRIICVTVGRKRDKKEIIRVAGSSI